MIESNSISILMALSKRLEDHDNNRIAVQEELHTACVQLKKEIDNMEILINNKLQVAFESEDSRLQKTLNDLHEILKKYETHKNYADEVNDFLEKVRGDLFVSQSYSLTKTGNSEQRYDIVITKNVSTELLSEQKLNKIENVKISSITNGFVSLKFKSPITDYETEAMKKNNLLDKVEYKVNLQEIAKNEEERNELEYTLNNTDNSFYPESLKINAHYTMKVKAIVNGMWETEWSDSTDFVPSFSDACGWRKCPKKVTDDRKYDLDSTNPRIATKTSGSGCWTTVLGNTPVPSNSVVSWDVKILESRRNNGSCIMVGVAPPDVDQNADRNFEKSGRYFNCFESSLFFGAPCCYKGKEYGPRKDIGQYVHKGDTVSVVMDTIKGEISFAVNGVNLGVAFDDIPLDKEFIPCVILGHKNDSVELSF